MVLAGRIALTLALLAGLGVAGVTWRLSQGPVELPWLARRIATAASGPGQTVSIDRLLLSWGGFAHPGTPPLRLRVLGMAASGSFGEARLERGDVALPLWPLLGGRPEADTAELTGLHVQLAAGGPAVQGKPPDLAAILRAAASPAPDNTWARLRHLHVHEATVEASGVPGRVAGLDVDLDRTDGGVTGRAVALLQAAQQQATLTLAAQLAPDGRGTRLQAGLTPVSPATLAGAAPPLAPLAALDAPVTLSGQASLGPSLDLIRAEADVGVGAGTVHAGQGTAPLLAADLHVVATPQALVLQLIRLDTAADPTSPHTRFTGQATAAPADAGGYRVRASLAVDQVAFADLAALWPEGTGGPGTRPWMTKNITAGRLAAGHLEVELAMPADLSDVTLGRIAAAIDGHDVTVHWLRPVPPLEHGEARLTMNDPDVIDIAVASAIQAGGSHGGLQYHNATIHLTGIAAREQYAEVRNGLTGPLADLLTVLNNPRIKLLSKRPLPMRDPAGEVTAQLHVGRLPLRDDVSLDDLVIETTARSVHTHLGGIAAGYDLDDGTLDLSANNDGLTVDGTAALASFPSRLKLGMDFRTGPPAQVQETVKAHSTVAMARLAQFGIPTIPDLGGSAELDTSVSVRRDGRTAIALAADLAQLTLAEPRMGLAKRAGEPGSADVRVMLAGDRIVSIEALRVEAPGISVRGEAEIEAGRPAGLKLERLVLGTGTDLSGEIRLDGPQRAVSIRLSGPSFDLSPALGGTDRPAFGSSAGVGMGGRAWTADLAADRVILGPGRSLTRVHAQGDSDGTILRRLAVSGGVADAPDGGPFQAQITPDSGGRRLLVDVADMGTMMHATAMGEALIGGRLHVSARWADRVPERPLGGVAELTGFRVRDAPGITRVLKALTIYGLVDLARGPGIGFTSLTAPFSLDLGVLTLKDARAISPSLGFTAQGRIDLGGRTADLAGTVVPAYFFNSLLGRVPVIGQLFTAEKGGGLFAAKVGVTGPLDDLQVSVNPLSAITPGILRGLFGTSAPGER